MGKGVSAQEKKDRMLAQFHAAAADEAARAAHASQATAPGWSIEFPGAHGLQDGAPASSL